METRYISQEAAIEYLMSNMEWIDADGYPVDDADEKRKIITDLVSGIPAANVRPVTSAAWLTGNDNPRTYGRIRAMCGRCGAFALYEMVNAGSYQEKLSNFCPNCGADMRETSAEGSKNE